MITADETPARISLSDWDERYRRLVAAGMCEPVYGGPLHRMLEAGDKRLASLTFDNSAASLRLWNFVLTETERLYAAAARGTRIIAAMKDLGTVPVIAAAAPNAVAFYPDGTWWAPCIMENTTGELAFADASGIDETFCPVRAMLGAFNSLRHFPKPALLTCAVGATCDDFSAIAQHLNNRGWPITWWEIPARREPDPGEPAIALADGTCVPATQVAFVRSQLAAVRDAIAEATHVVIDDAALQASIAATNALRSRLQELRAAVAAAPRCPLPALEMLLAEMLAPHFCSNRAEACVVLADLLAEVRQRVARHQGVLPADHVRVFWVNPVADLRAMNVLEDCGGRLVGADFMFCHAIDLVPLDEDPLRALARAALADPMVGPGRLRAARVVERARALDAHAVVVSRIPGASHCAFEGAQIVQAVRAAVDIPIVEIEVPPLCDAVSPALQTRLETLIEIARNQRHGVAE